MFLNYEDELVATAGSMAHEGVELCDGADARYVGVANERVFAALPASTYATLAGACGDGAHVLGTFRRAAGPYKSPAPLRPHSYRDAGATPLPRHSSTVTPATAALSQQLTPVRRGLLGRSPQQRPTAPPPLPPSQTAQAPPPRAPPHHSTSYDQDHYQRCLTAALLSGAEAGGRHANVLSFPMRTPNRPRTSSGSRTTPDVPNDPSAGVSQHTAGLTNTPPSTTGELDDAAVWAGTASLDSPTREAARRGGEPQAPAIAVSWPAPASQPCASTFPERDGVVSMRAEAAEGEGTYDAVVVGSPAMGPLEYFLRAPPVWPTVALMTPPHRRWGGDASDGSEEGDYSAVIVDSGVLPLGAAEQQHRNSAAGHAARCVASVNSAASPSPASSHTPSSMQSEPALPEAAYTSSGGPDTPHARCGASEAVVTGCADSGTSTPLRLPCSTTQRFAAFTSPCTPYLSVYRESAAATTAHHHGSGDTDDDEDGHPATTQLPLSTPVGRRVTAVGLSCATPGGATTPVRSGSASPSRHAPQLLHGMVAPAAASVLAGTPASPAALRRSSGSLPGAALPSFHATRRSSTPPFLSTPVRHHENSMRSNSALAVGSAALRRGPGASPLETTPTRPSIAAAPYHSPHHLGLRPALDAGGRRSGSGSGMRGRPHTDSQSRTSPRRRDVFHFTRALTAGEVSMSERHHPLSWGCFGILVAQPAEVWCVGKQQPFRLYPAAVREAPAWMPRAETLTVTAVATTERLTLAHWETAAGAASVGAAAAAPAAALATAGSAAAAVVYAAIGTADGDVIVYGYARCPPSAPGAIPVSLDVDAARASDTHAVQLQWHGILHRADRVGDDGASDARAAELEGTEGDSAASHTVSVLHIAEHWLYIADQRGHVSRYSLRHTRFLESVTASRPSASVASSGATGGPPAASVRTGAAARLHACMPVHHFARPPLVGGAGAAQRVQPLPAPTYHYAVDVGEPVYHLAVIDNQSCLAVGTQTRLLVYRTAQLPRVADAPQPPSPATPRERQLATVEPLVVVRDAAQPVRCFAWMLCDYEAVVRTPNRRGHLGMFAGAAELGDDDGAGGVGKSEYDEDSDGSSPMPLTSDDEVGAVRSFATGAATGCRGHNPTPSLVFAVATYGSAAATTPAEEAAHASAPSWGARLRTDIRVFRLVTETTVACCTVDYPARMLAVLPGTTQLIIATGGEAELIAAALPHERGGAVGGSALPSTPTGPGELHAGLSLSTGSTSPASQSFSVTTPAGSPSAVGSRSPMLAARRPAVPTAGWAAPWHAPFATRPTLRSANAAEGSGAAAPQQQQQQHQHHRQPPAPRAVAGEERDGYLFLLKVCPADDVAAGDLGEDTGVRLRVHGEVRLGEGESAVCGSVSPALDHVSVLVRPTEVEARWGRAAAAAAATATAVRDPTRHKVKVWRVLTEAPTVTYADVSPGCGPLFLSEAQQQMESLR